MYLKYPRKIIEIEKKPVKESKTIEVPLTSKESSLRKNLQMLEQTHKFQYNPHKIPLKRRSYKIPYVKH